MIFHSIIPMDIVFGNYRPCVDGTGENITGYIEMEHLGEKVQVSPVENGGFVINRLISTSPKAYLNPALQPGSIIPRK